MRNEECGLQNKKDLKCRMICGIVLSNFPQTKKRRQTNNAMTLNRYKVSSKSPIQTGKVKIEVETKYDSKERMAPATLTLKVNGKQVGQGRIERSVPGGHRRKPVTKREWLYSST